MRKISCFLLVFVLILTVLLGCKKHKPAIEKPQPPPLTPAPAATVPKESPETDFTYEISQNGEFVYINQYIGSSETVVIPSKIQGLPVVTIKGVFENGALKRGAFEGCNITTLLLPDSIKAIGRNAFKDCQELADVTFSINIEQILDCAFENCIKLKSIDLSQTNLHVISNGAFRGCIGLSEIKFSKSLTEIDKNAFYNCSALIHIDLPESLIKIYENAFVNCTSLETISVPKELDLYCLKAPSFYNIPSLEKIIFKEGRETITGYAFFDITSNVEILIPKSVKEFSPASFFIHGPARFVFEGDCPTITDINNFYGNPTIFYNPDTSGWSSCVLQGQIVLQPIH